MDWILVITFFGNVLSSGFVYKGMPDVTSNYNVDIDVEDQVIFTSKQNVVTIYRMVPSSAEHM